MLFALAAGAIAASAQDEAGPAAGFGRKNALVGSWMTHNTGSADTLWTLQSFSRDGRTFATGQGDTMPPVVSPQIGAWKNIGGGRYKATFVSIIYDPSSGVPPGTFVGTAKITEIIRPNWSGTSLTGHFSFQMFDPDGNVIYANEGEFVGTRITAD
jgi:hypothetical protein